MRRALIGHSGFVGSNLKKQHDFTDFYNSRNFREMSGESYDLVVCAGVSAIKWMANKEPDEDLSRIKALEEVLSKVQTKEFILISTIDVYPTTRDVDEDFDCGTMDNHAYGRHRLAFEKFCEDCFEECTTLRLPGLFGDGLKKNVIYDLLNDNCLEMINAESSFQYYFLNNLWRDIQIVQGAGIKLVNFATEPISTKEIANIFFQGKTFGENPLPEAHYDLHTKYASHWGKNGRYIYEKSEIITQLQEFIGRYPFTKD